MKMRMLFSVALMLVASQAYGQFFTGPTVWSEDFEGATLAPSPEESPSFFSVINDPNNAGIGWTADDSGVPGIGDQVNGGIDDWEGWAFTTSAHWIAADDQRRSEFIDGDPGVDPPNPYGAGIVAVADPDEWDDVNSPADNIGFYNAFMTSPTIDISNVGPALGIEFGSSWRDEAFDDDGVAGDPSDDNMNNQTATLIANFDVGGSVEILRWESDPASPFFKDDAPNELIQIATAIPSGASSVSLEFGLTQAGNDWWWAVDNISVGSTVPEPTSLALCGLALVAAGAYRRR